jgi:aarF domain-containing kinase
MDDRRHLIDSQGPIWTGDESTHDAVLRMLVDAHKPLRTGDGAVHDAADKRIKQWMRNLDMTPPPPVVGSKSASDTVDSATNIDSVDSVEADAAAATNPHHTTIPRHLHRPWHSTYTGDNVTAASRPQIKYGDMSASPSHPDRRQFSDLELRLPPNADGTARKALREKRSSVRLQGRVDRARESAIDYRLGIPEDVAPGEDDAPSFRGQRQLLGRSVLGARGGASSGMKAWAGLVEERIQVSGDEIELCSCG